MNINIDKKIVMAFADPVDTDEKPYKNFTDNFTGEGVHLCYIFDTPEEFIEKWLEIRDEPRGMWYWVLDDGKCICSGALDPDDIDVFKEYWNLKCLLEEETTKFTIKIKNGEVYINNKPCSFASEMDKESEKDDLNKKALLALANEMGYEATFLFEEMADRLNEMLEEIDD